jgi:hypothetical protein
MPTENLALLRAHRHAKLMFDGYPAVRLHADVRVYDAVGKWDVVGVDAVFTRDIPAGGTVWGSPRPGEA